jgi:hypothetical protein
MNPVVRKRMKGTAARLRRRHSSGTSFLAVKARLYPTPHASRLTPAERPHG